MDALWLDIRQTLRALFRNPGFSILAVLTMALGIGAATGVFSAFHAVLLRSLPYPEPDRLVFGMATFKTRNTGLSAHDYFDFRDQATGFESLGSIMHFTSSVASTGGDRPESLDYTYVSTNFFPTLGVAPALGRGFTVEEGRPAPVVGRGQIQHLPEVAVISHALWQRRFAGSPAAIGSSLVLRGDPVTVVGVMPEGFRFFLDADIWLPMRLNGERATPGVTAAGLVNRLPVLQGGGSTQVWAPERPGERSFSQQALGRVVLPGYFEAMGMRLVAGRDVSDSDRTDTPQVVVIGEAVARKLYPGETAVGQQIAADFGGKTPATLEIVGVVADARLNDLEDGPSWVMYLPYHQATSAVLEVVIRTASDPEGVTRALRDKVWRRNKDVPVADVTVLSEAIRHSMRTQETLAGTVASFSLLALLLAAVGLFGVLAYQVNQRQHELGIRMALGAGQGHVLATVLRQGLAATGIGLAIGVVVGLALTRLMAGLLYEVAPTDPMSFVAAAACLIVVALAACLVPALRALAVQPVRALRYE